jgi:DNA-binding SARP family transcriptional activator
MEFRVLGPVEVWSAGERVNAGHVKQRSVLAVLLLELGKPVPAELLIDRVWGDSPPASVRNNLYAYVAKLKAVIAGTGDDGVMLTRRRGGYLLEADPDTVDLYGFRLRVSRAATADDQRAAKLLSEALGLWRGPALAGLSSPWLSSMRVTLEQQRITAMLDYGDIALRQGQHAALSGTLAEEAVASPANERLIGQLMLALYRSGRQAEALRWFEQTRRHLAEELGADPGPALARLHQQILRSDPALAGPADGHFGGAPVSQAPGNAVATVPRELPADTTAFTGRSAELAELDRRLNGARAKPSAVMISAISGTAGVGKTALAVHWAHLVSERFPDGQLYVNLRGYDPGQPMTAAEALAGFLRALGVPGKDIPVDVAERSARYRSLLAGKQMLVLLDNAGDVEQARPLLPGTPTCAVLVTSRDSLTGLVARDGAQRSDLDLLSDAEAVALLRALIGPRVDAEPAAATELAAQCARLPLALRLAAELAVARASTSLAELAGELADGRRLDLLDAGGDERTEVRAVISWSYRNLDVKAARAFRLIGLHPGPDVDPPAAAALIGSTTEQASGLLDELARAHLIQPAEPGRYGMHDLLREYARELVIDMDTAEGRQAALSRLFGYYRSNAAAATDVLYPAGRRWRPGAGRPGPSGTDAFTPATARAWLDTELANLVATIAYAAAHDWPGHAIELAATLSRARVAPDISPPTRSVWQRLMPSLPGPSRAKRTIAIASIAVVCAALATAGIVWSSESTGVPTAARYATAERIITPLYAFPTLAYWSSLARAAPMDRGAIVDICAPDGTGSGCPGDKPADEVNPAWPATVHALRRAGVTPFYYISTNDAATALATVKAEVKDAIAWYKTPDVFFDLVSTSCSNVPYYRSLYRYVHHLGGLVMLNPGTVPPSCYMPASDVLQVFTGTQAQFQSVTFPSWMARYQPNRFAAVVFAGTRSGLGTDINDAAKDRIGNLYVNDETGTPNYATLPTFWPTEVSDVKATARPSPRSHTSAAIKPDRPRVSGR